MGTQVLAAEQAHRGHRVRGADTGLIRILGAVAYGHRIEPLAGLVKGPAAESQARHVGVFQGGQLPPDDGSVAGISRIVAQPPSLWFWAQE